MSWNRNIVTARDVRAVQQKQGKSIDLGPAKFGAPASNGAEDGWREKLLKYIPTEALSLYLATEGVIKSGVSGKDQLIVWLSVGLIVSLIFNVLYLRIVWKIERHSQIAISTLALVVYVFATGGVFEEAGLREPFQATLALIITTAFLAFFSPPSSVETPADVRTPTGDGKLPEGTANAGRAENLG